MLPIASRQQQGGDAPGLCSPLGRVTVGVGEDGRGLQVVGVETREVPAGGAYACVEPFAVALIGGRFLPCVPAAALGLSSADLAGCGAAVWTARLPPELV